jgi:hypothetical protein
MTPEGEVKEKVKKLLNKYGVYYDMNVPFGYGKQTLDFVCCAFGMYLAIETKAPDKKLTARQKKTALDMRRAGGVVVEIIGLDSPLFERLEEWLKWLQETQRLRGLS